MRALFSLLLFSLVSGFYVFAQEIVPKNNPGHFTLSLGAGHISLSDKVFSPLVYRGTGLLLELKYASHSIKRKHDLTLNFNSTSLSPKLNSASKNSIDNFNGFLNYQYQRAINHGKWEVFLGGGLHNFLSLRTFNIDPDDEVGWDIFSSINLATSLNRAFQGKHYLEFKLSYPLLAYVIGRMRVPKDFPDDVFHAFANNGDEAPVIDILKSGDWLGINKFIDLILEINYRHQLSRKLAADMKYRFRYYKYPKLLNVNYGTSQFMLGLSYKL